MYVTCDTPSHPFMLPITKDGGADGTTVTSPTYTYTIWDRTKTHQLATGVTPVRNRSSTTTDPLGEYYYGGELSGTSGSSHTGLGMVFMFDDVAGSFVAEVRVPPLFCGTRTRRRACK